MSASKYITALIVACGLISSSNLRAAPAEKFNAEDPTIHVITVTNQASNSVVAKASAKARFVTLRAAQVKEVYRYDKKKDKASPVKAFYLPPEATEFVQLVVEQKGGVTTYFLKGLRDGKTVGGVVQREWLDKKGFTPNSVTDTGRVQKAVKDEPYFITVEP